MFLESFKSQVDENLKKLNEETKLFSKIDLKIDDHIKDQKNFMSFVKERLNKENKN